ncbi:MAG TPA: hypothetical protein VFM74_06605 [Candidatus Limnocylindria bacterium]|nr:hypothetical protein [Candidatus Limnocylindria bacterium]
MTTSQRRLQRIGVIGLAGGAILVATGGVFAGELSGLLRGYGLMLAGSAVYLVGGLRLVAWRESVVARRASASVKRDFARQP